MQQEKVQVEKAIAKLRFKQDNGDLIFGFGRTANFKNPSASILTSNIASLSKEVFGDNLQLYEHDVTVIYLVYGLLGFL